MLLDQIYEPQLERIIEVEQRSFGVLTDASNQDYLETIGISPCIGVYLESCDTKVLAHLDPLNVRFGDIDHIFQYFERRWLTFAPDKAVLVASSLTGAEEVEEVTKYLTKKGIGVDLYRSDADSISIIVDRAGRIGELTSLQSRDFDQAVYNAQLKSIEQSVKRDPKYRLECATDRGWAGNLELLSVYDGVFDNCIGKSSCVGLPLNLVAVNGVYYQNMGFSPTQKFVKNAIESITRGMGGNIICIHHTGEYIGDRIVRKLSSDEQIAVDRLLIAK
jgi:hypothetical protein